MSIDEKRDIWSSFGRAIDADPREHRTITGASGIEHTVQSINVDDAGRRVILVIAEPNPRIAAMVRADIQATMVDTNVLVARPIFFDLAEIAKSLFGAIGASHISAYELNVLFELFKAAPDNAKNELVGQILSPAMEPVANALAKVQMPPLSHLSAIVQQAAYINWLDLYNAIKNGDNASLSLEKILNIDNIAVDRSYGVCSIPLYELAEQDWDLMSSGSDIPEVRKLLERLNIYQYFYPSPDQASLALVDRGISDRGAIIEHVERLPSLGHPAGVTELIDHTTLPQMLEQLREAGYIAEGELGYEISETGRTARSVVRYRPRESAISRLLAAFKVNVNVNPSDLLK